MYAMLLALASLLSCVPAGDGRTALDAAGGFARDGVAEPHRAILLRASKLHHQRVDFARMIAMGRHPQLPDGAEVGPADLADMDRKFAELSAAEEWLAGVEQELHRRFPRRPPALPAGPS